MRQAIAYYRVSTERQGESGIGSSLQRAHIKAFAKERGYRIRGWYSDDETGMGADSPNLRPGRRSAVERSNKTHWPIIVAGFDRFARHAKTIEDFVLSGKLRVVSARLGENATNAEIRSEAVRDELAGKLIGKRTKDALKVLKDQGVKLGNKAIREVAQPKAVEANVKKAKLHLAEFERALAEVRNVGAKTAKEIAEQLNERGFPAARGGRWTSGNVARAIGNLKYQHRGEARRRDLTQMFDGDVLSGAGIKRCHRAMISKGLTPDDVELRIAVWDSETFDEERRNKLLDWVIAAENEDK